MPTLSEDRFTAIAVEVPLAARRLLRTPVVTLVTVAALAIGVGTGTALFSLANGYLFPRFHASNPNELVRFVLVSGDDRLDFAILKPEVIERVLDGSYRHLTHVSALGRGIKPVVIEGDSRLQAVEGVRGSYFQALGPPMLAGRSIREADSSPDRVPSAVLSERLWRERMRADPKAVGATIRLDGRPATVVGIVAAPFDGLYGGLGGTDVWVSGQLQPAGRLMATLAAGSSFELANTEITTRFSRLAEASPSHHLALSRGARPDPPPTAYALAATIVLMSVVVLTAVASSLAGLVSARLLGRRAEIALRQAVGAQRRDIVRLLMIEAALTMFTAGIVGWFAASILAPMGIRHLFASLPVPLSIDLLFDGWTFVYTVVVSVSVWFGLVSALGTSAAQIDALMTTSSQGLGGVTPGSRLLRSRLITIQVTVATALLVSAGALVRTSLDELSFQPGYELAGAAVAWFSTASDESTSAAAGFTDRIRREPLRGVIGAGSGLPADGQAQYARYSLNPTLPSGSAGVRYVTADYFAALHLPVRHGREFADGESGRQAILSEAVAAALAPGSQLLGRRINIEIGEEAQVYTVVGVVADAQSRSRGVDRAIYLPFERGAGSRRMVVIVRHPQALSMLRESIAQVVRAGATLSLDRVASLRDDFDYGSLAMRQFAKLVVTLGVLAFIVVLIGVYGVLSHLAVLRRKDFAIMRALGATNLAIIWAVALEVGKALPRGGLFGVAIGFAATFMMQRWGVNSLDPIALLCVPIALGSLMICVAVVPVWRLLRQPMSNQLLNSNEGGM